MSQQPWQNAPSARTDSILAPSPMGVGALFRTAWRLMTSKLGLLLGLNILQSVVLGVVITIAAIIGVATAFGTIGSNSSPTTSQVVTMVLVGLVLGALVLAVTIWVSIKFSAMGIAALDLRARGQESSWSSASAATRGVVRRALVVILLEVLAIAAVYLVFGLVLGSALAASGDPGAGTVALMVVLGLLLTLAGLYVGVRLSYLNQVLAVERLSGMDVFRRAWQLTRGRFWPTLGRGFLGVLAPAVVLTVLGALQSANVSASDRIDGTPANAGLASLLGLLMFVVEVLTGIWMVAYMTTMYIDQVRRHAAAGIAPVAVAPAPAVPTMAPATQFDALGADTWGQQPVGPLGTQQPTTPAQHAPAQPVAPQPVDQSPWTVPGAQQPAQPQEPPRVVVDDDDNPWNRPADGKGGL